MIAKKMREIDNEEKLKEESFRKFDEDENGSIVYALIIF